MEISNNIISFINENVVVVNDYLWSYILIIMLVATGIYFSFKTNFVQFKYFIEMFRLLGDGFSDKDVKKSGSISSFQAFCISTSSRVGTGNIAGIAIAVAVGGPGSVFWMWIIALIGSASSFVESTLAQIYKIRDGKAFRGGPAYYMEQGLNKKWMGVVFSILISICYGFVFNAVQANTVSLAFNNAFGISKVTMAIGLGILTAIVIFGGVHRIAKVSEVIVPIFAGLYIVVAIVIVIINITEIPGIIKLIVSSAFDFKSMATGGFIGTVMTGVKRGLFSNEAGMGSAPNAAATADVKHPVVQGLIQSLGVFTDTIIICSCTAFMVLLYSGYSSSSATGIELAQEALTSHIGGLGAIFVAVCIFLFAFSSIVGNYYYGESNIEFMSGSKVKLNIFRVFVVAMVCFGSITQVEVVWNLADLFMALMAIINIIAILFLGKYAFMALNDYTKQKKAGIKNPVFTVDDIPELQNVSEWHGEKNI
ncbi:alanine:cation symporter family protein [Clostridioides mangenotii]|uniref:alanine/glycine:cation symporter family protein n=1 Tax=Metaclostridioides mangenotii TaxID=1540 RepID=UPI00214A25C9|nr:alanine/glycine:cation symporter family protein [Clostridioides mangenotii]MCR1954465.1 alanine:cation symporter family protein [Clostridioides mangenotii]